MGMIPGIIYMINTLANRITQFGKKPLCNLKEERALKVANFVFPLCYRCTGLVLGGILSYLSLIDISPIHGLIMLVPLPIDSFTQYFSSYKSNNFKRFTTGFLFGVGLSILR